MNQPAMSAADAAARLRYATAVRTRTRRAVLHPGTALVGLGVVVVLHALLVDLWPHNAGVAASWLAALLVGRLAVVRRQRRGIVAAPRLRLICAAAVLCAVLAAVGLGANLFVSAIAAATAVAASMAGVPSIAAAAIVTGAIGDLVLLEGVPRATAELLFGTGMIAVGIVSRALEREEP